MRRPIIHLLVALLTFALGTFASLLLNGAFTPSHENATEQRVAARTETSTVPPVDTETILGECGCAQGETESVKSLKDPPVPISGGVLNGKAISLPQPPYPPIAMAAHAYGTVMVQIVIDERGCIQSARAVSGHPLLQSAAVQAARHACFTPTRLSGQPVKVTGVISYNFVLE